MLGGLYQSVLRAELASGSASSWRPIVNGQAEIAGFPDELLAVSPSAAPTSTSRSPTARRLPPARRSRALPRERAALTREASADTRPVSPVTVPPTWRHGGAPKPPRSAGPSSARRRPFDRRRSSEPDRRAHRPRLVDAVSPDDRRGVGPTCCKRSATSNGPCRDVGTPLGDALERAADHVIAQLVELDPASETTRRVSDRRSVWIEPTAPGTHLKPYSPKRNRS